MLELDLPFRIQPINGPNFDAISGPFVLGLDRGPQFARERRQMYESVARIDSDGLRAHISREADQILDTAVATSGRIDVAYGYAHPIAARTAAHLFGIPGPTEADLMRVCRALFRFSFLANPGETEVEARAGRAAAELRTWMTDEIAHRRRDGITMDDVLGRLLAIQDQNGAPLDAETAPLPPCRASSACSGPNRRSWPRWSGMSTTASGCSAGVPRRCACGAQRRWCSGDRRAQSQSAAA